MTTGAAIERAIQHERELLVGAATDVTETSFGRVVLNRDYPGAHSHNVVLVDRPTTAEAIAEESGPAMAQAGVEWTAIWVKEEDWADDLAAPLSAAGYERSHDLYMAWTGTPVKKGSAAVRHVSFEEMRDSIIAYWQTTGRSVENSAALADRPGTYARCCELSYFGVEGSGTFRSFCEVLRRGTVGQIDSVITDPAWRRRGYAASVVLQACLRLRSVGCDLIFLVTDNEDWPKELYRTLGFSDIGIRSTFG